MPNSFEDSKREHQHGWQNLPVKDAKSKWNGRGIKREFQPVACRSQLTCVSVGNFASQASQTSRQVSSCSTTVRSAAVPVCVTQVRSPRRQTVPRCWLADWLTQFIKLNSFATMHCTLFFRYHKFPKENPACSRNGKWVTLNRPYWTTQIFTARQNFPPIKLDLMAGLSSDISKISASNTSSNELRGIFARQSCSGGSANATTKAAQTCQTTVTSVNLRYGV